MSVQKHLVVVSHRRSGTHLTIDSIGNNADDFRDSYHKHGAITLDRFLPCHNVPDVAQLEKSLIGALDMINEPSIFKTHSYSDIDTFFKSCNDCHYKLIQELFSIPPIILYVIRNPLDTLWSLYNYQSKYDERVRSESFSDYIRENNDHVDGSYATHINRVEHLKIHIEGWVNRSDVVVVKYEDWIRDYSKTLERTMNRCGFAFKPSRVLDARLSSRLSFHKLLKRLRNTPFLGYITDRVRWRLYPDVEHTSICFRNGGIGDGKKNSTAEDVTFIKDHMSDYYYE